jgi:hypothetical protein
MRHPRVNADKFYDKAAELMDRAVGEEPLMRGFYEGLARSYYRLAWEADHLGKSETKEPQPGRNPDANDTLARLLRLAVAQSFGRAGGTEQTEDETKDETQPEASSVTPSGH